MDIRTKRLVGSIFALLFILLGCGGGSTTDNVDGEALLVSTRSATPGELIKLSHPSIKTGEIVEVEVESESGFTTLSFEAMSDGHIIITLPPIIDSSTEEISSGTVRLSLVGVDSSVTVVMDPLLSLASELAPGKATILMIDATLENYAAIFDQLTELTTRTDGAFDSSEMKAAVEEIISQLTDMRNEIDSTGELTIKMADDSTLTLTETDISIIDRWLVADLQGISSALKSSNATAIVAASRSNILTRSSEAQELNEEEIRLMIAEMQARAGTNVRSLTAEQLDLMLAAAGVPSNVATIVGGGVSVGKEAYNALVAGEQIYVLFRGAHVTLGITANALNGDRVKQEELNSWAARFANLGLAVVATGAATGAIFLSGPTLGAAATAASLASIASAFGLAGAWVNYDIAVIHSSDMKIHIPAKGVEFSELRVQKVGTFSFPEIEVTLDDDISLSNDYDLQVYGIQNNQFWNPAAWSALSIARNRGSAEKITYGNALRGEVNTARGMEGNPPIPAPSLSDFTMFGMLATGVKDYDQGNAESSRAMHGEVDIKYIDGAVVFTFQIENQEDGSFNISARISNASSIPLSIYSLEFEIEPGVTAYNPIFDYSIPYITIEPGQDRQFDIDNVTIELPPSYKVTPKNPRLLISNAGVEPYIQQFWGGLRSEQALSGPFTTEIPEKITGKTVNSCPMTLVNDGSDFSSGSIHEIKIKDKNNDGYYEDYISCSYHKNNQLAVEFIYIDFLENGIRKNYYETGKLKKETPYIDGNKSGLEIGYYESGNTKYKIAYEIVGQYSIQQGIEYWYYDNESNQVQREAVNVAGYWEGEVYTYSEDGEEVRCEFYEGSTNWSPITGPSYSSC